MKDVAAVIVHHNRHQDIADVVLSLASAGIDQTRIVVVDNSEKPHLAQELESSIHPATVLFVPNDGYGAAANAGLRHIDSALADAAYVLVATHEVGIEENSLAALRDVLEGNSHLSAVGPTLVDSESKKNDVWSQGGGFTPWGRMPRHVRRDTGPTPSFVVREWLDGAVVLYRRSHLGFDPFDEAFFLYMEEVDLHLRLAYQGTPVAWVPGARASQSSSGTPARLFARNLRYLHAKHRMGRGGLRAMVPIARRAAGFAARGEWNRFAQLARGVLEPLPRPRPCIILVNPLGVALSHYAAEFRSVCATAGVQMVGVSFAEPSAAGDGRLRWVWRYLRSLQMARSLSRGSHSRIVVAWPVLGFLDPLLIVLFARRADIVMHDPKPLVHAVGYGAFGRSVARRLMSRVKYLVHSGAAQREMLGLGFPSRAVVEMNHPVLPPTEAPRAQGNPVVRVLGQYKPDRDTDLMRVVAESNPGDWRYEVCGRGWPDVPGWEIESRFLSETEFEEKLTSATVVLVPYHRFYQSGVALRAMESGTPVVAPKDSVLGPLVSPEHWITDSPDSAARAVFHAVTQENEGWTQAFVGFRERAVRQISGYLDGGHDERG